MNINPYEAPATSLTDDAVVRPPLAPGEPHQPWTPSEIVTSAWALVRERKLAVYGAFLLVGVLPAVPSIALGVYSAQHPERIHDLGLSTGVGLIAVVLGAFFQVGITRASLTLARGGEPTIEQLLSGARYLPVLVLHLLSFAVTTAATALLPTRLMYGVYFGWYVLFGVLGALAQPLIVDAGKGPIAALVESVEAMGGYFWRMLVLLLVSGLVLVGSVIPCGLLIPLGAAVVVVANAILYLRITGRTAPANP